MLYTDLSFSRQKKHRVGLEHNTVVLFRNCPSGGSSWPSMLDRTDKGEVSRTRPTAELFGPNRKHIVIVTGREDQKNDEDWSETTIRYSLSFTRISAVKS